MQDFWLYFQLGWRHILSWQGYEHILFIVALCVIYALPDWKKVFFLILAFTIGYSITLPLNYLKFIPTPPLVIKFLIPATVLILAIANIFNKRPKRKGANFKYFLILCFGLIHGFGFSFYLKSVTIKSTGITLMLSAFDLGLILGQLILVIATLLISFLLVWMAKIKRWDWSFFISSAIFGISLMTLLQRLPAIF